MGHRRQPGPPGRRPPGEAAFALLCFDATVRYEARVPVGGRLPEAALFVSCDGGTDIFKAMGHGLDVVAQAGGLRKADVVLVTDGESTPKAAPALRERATSMGVTLLGFGIGVSPKALAPWCDEAVSIESLDTLDEKAAEALANL